jgi:hypothetical protein
MEKKLMATIDQFIVKVNLLLKEFLAAWTMYDVGRDAIDTISNDVSIAPCVGYNQRVAPIPILFIKQYKRQYPHFILEVYQNKLVQVWNGLLNDIFCLLLEEHMAGTRKFVELKKQQIKVDFRSDEHLLVQLKESCSKDFAFWEYDDRPKVINNVLNPDGKRQKELRNIRKHILIRNVIQHAGGIVNDYLLKELGSKEIILKDKVGKQMSLKKDDKILLSIPELYDFLSCLLYVAQTWRG